MLYGLLQNRLMEASAQPEPKVGMGATVVMYSDRHAATIIKVTPCTVTVQRDKAKRTDQNGMSESQSYAYEPDPKGDVTVFRKTKRGWRGPMNRGLVIGDRDEYYDYSF